MTLGFTPFLPWSLLIALAVISVIVTVFALWRGMRGAWIRGLAALALLAALANPVLMQEDREQLSTIVPVIVDRSQSQQTPERIKMTDDALALLKERLSRFPQIEPRYVDAKEPVDTDAPSTRLFNALSAAVADV